MTDKSYPRLRKLRSEAHMPANPAEFLRESEESRIAEKVWEYYTKENTTSLNPLQYKIMTENEAEHEIRSNLSVSDEGFPIEEKINQDRRYFSEYEDEILEEVGLDRDKHWNGDIADIRYEDDEISIGKTDYYSTSPIVRMLSAEINYQDANPLRDYFLKDLDDFKKPKRPISATSGGVMIANRGNGKWVMLIGKRSKRTHMNSGMFSIFPNGKSEFLDLKNGGFKKTVEREFREEIFSNQKKGDMFYDKHVDTKRVVSGWNLRTGSFTTGHALIMNTRLSYDVLNELSQHNDEIEDIIEIPITDISTIIEKANLGNMSASAIPTVFETLSKIDKSEKFPDMPYNVEREIPH